MKRRVLMIVMALLLTAGPTLAQDSSYNTPTESDAPAAGNDGGKAADGQDAAPADSEKAPDDQKEQEKPGDGGFLGGMGFPLLLVGMLVLMFVLSSRGRKKEQQRRRHMLDEMKKGDKVVTIGGIVGTAIEVRDLEVVVQVSEGTRMKFLRSAIARVGEDAKAEEAKEQENK